ncbi:MAG: nitroreductase family protein [Bacteroidales bacterium]|jgi:nitroreductase|nr:nitroreductase family protein [Bacteroidales bacterium]
MRSFEKILLERRSIRKYSAEDVDDATLNAILEMGCRASTTGNMQVYSIIVTRDGEMKKRLAPFHFNQRMVAEAPVTLTFCADFNRFNRWCRLRSAEPGYDNFLSFVTAAIDAVAVAQTVAVAAEARGLGICYLGTTTYTAGGIIEALGLPAGVVPVTTITLGWPAEQPEQVDRLPLEAVVHCETYGDYSADDINRHYASRESRADSLRYVSENGKETLAQVFTDVRYKKADNEHFSEAFLGILKKQGFL